MPEPIGVVARDRARRARRVGLVGRLCRRSPAGNVVVALASERLPLLAADLGEVLGITDVPAGVVNLLSGLRSELVKPLASHPDIDALVDTSGDAEVTRLAADSVTRVARRPGGVPGRAGLDSLSRIEPFVELKTAWHPVGT